MSNSAERLTNVKGRGGESCTLDTDFIKGPTTGGFHANASGACPVQFFDGSTATLQVIKGASYAYVINQIQSGGDVTDGDIIGLF